MIWDLATHLTVLAQGEGGAGPGPLQGCMEMAPFFLIIIGIFYFMVIRPQRKQQTEQQRFLDGLQSGDRVITTSGVFGRIVSLHEGQVTIDVGDRTRIRFVRSHVSRYQTDDESESGGRESRGSSRKRT
jgi:preprotein translocase subunit YajC